MKKQGTIQTIKIDDIGENQTKTKMVITSDGKKFDVWKKEYQKASDSEAYTQFQKGRFAIGDEVTVEYSESDKSFVNEKGETINYTARSIWRFLSNESKKYDFNANGTLKAGQVKTIEEYNEIPF